MAVQTINLGDFGSSGFLPDVAPSLLPQTGFSFSKNWRFKKGGFAEVSYGYTNVFDTRGVDDSPYKLGTSDTDLTFLYTWELADDNALVVYDKEGNNLFFTENAGDGDLTEYNLSIANVEAYSSTYDDSGLATPAAANCTIDNAGALHIGFDSAADATAAAANFLEGRLVAIVDDNKNKLFGNADRKMLVDATTSSGVMTAIFETPLDASAITDNTLLHFRSGTPFEHDILGDYKWDGTDALGVPVFNNEVDAPLEFVDAKHPYVQQLSEWPEGGTCKQLSSFGAVLVAVGYINDNDSTPVFERGNTRTLAFSNPIINPGELPEWDFGDLDSEAQLIDMSLYTDGLLVSAYEANGRLIVNSTTDTIAITDNGDGTYSPTKLEIGGGVLTKRTSVPIPNGFFCIGNGQFYIHDTNTHYPIGYGQYVDTWFSMVDEERLDEIQVTYDPRTRTVWIKTPTSEVAQEMWIIDLDNNYTLSVLDDMQEVKYMEWSADGTPAESLSWDTMPVLEWEDIQQNSWNEFPIIEFGDYRNRLLSCGGREVFVHDYGTTYNGRAIEALLQKAYFKLGAGNSRETFQFDRIIPWIQGDDGEMVSIRVGGANTLGSDTTFTPFRTYTIGTTEKLDFRRQAKWGAISFSCQTSGTQLSGVEITVNSSNRR